MVIPNAVRAVWAFMNCSELTSVTLCNGLEEIGVQAFDGCTLLQEIVIPNAIRAVKRKAFHDCKGSTRVTLGDGLEEIRACAFKNTLIQTYHHTTRCQDYIKPHSKTWYCQIA